MEAETTKQEVKEKAKFVEAQAASVGTRVVEEFRKFEDFEVELNKGYFDAFQIGFDDCKRVVKAFPGLDLSSMVAVESEEGKTIEIEEVAEVAAEPKAELAAIDEAIIEMVVEAESVINKAVEAFGVGLSPAPEK